MVRHRSHCSCFGSHASWAGGIPSSVFPCGFVRGLLHGRYTYIPVGWCPRVLDCGPNMVVAEALSLVPLPWRISKEVCECSRG